MKKNVMGLITSIASENFEKLINKSSFDKDIIDQRRPNTMYESNRKWIFPGLSL
jgi:hypothetical protein